MKLLGIDFGEKRIGIAISDEEGRMAFPHSVLLNQKGLIEKFKKIINEEKIEKVVIGESKNFAGQPNAIMENIQKFIKEWKEKISTDIVFEPEFLTSIQAEKIQGKNEMLDASAAAIILQSYIDKTHQ